MAEQPREFSDFADLLTAEAGRKYPYCRGYFLLRPPEGSKVLRCSELVAPEMFAELVDGFAVTFPGADRRAGVSMWTLYYFSILTIGTAIAALETRRLLPVALDETRVCIKAGAPHAFLLRDFGTETDDADRREALHAVLRMHAEPVVDAIASSAKVSRKLIWTNIGGYLFWIVDEASRLGEGEAAARWSELVRARNWPDGWANPLHDLIRPVKDEGGASVARRRVCCLRYVLPGVAGCGAICPLPAGRNSQAHSAT